jgi:secondary thiamine-phosphate synthase enzyme
MIKRIKNQIKEMKIITKKIALETKNQLEFIDVTSEVEEILSESTLAEGSVLIYAPHSTASIVINHNEPMLLQDLTRMLYKIAPIDERYGHDMFELTKHAKSDGRSNGHSHSKNVILGCSETIPFQDGELMIGDRQSIFFVELDGARKRDFLVQIVGN